MIASLRTIARPCWAAFACVALALGLLACGEDSGTDEEAAAPAPSAESFPKVEGRSLDELLAQAETSEEIVISPAGAVFTPGDERFAFGVFDVDGSQIEDAEVAIYAQAKGDDQARGPFPARVESLKTKPSYVAKTTASDPDAAKVVYVARVPFKQRGEWRLVALVRTGEGMVATRLPSIVVKPQPGIPGPGDPAPRVHTPTADDVGGNLALIDTRQPPSTMHEDDLADVLGERPVVLLFATPALCVSRVCGPVVDIAEQVKDEYGDEVAFIHMEIYKDNEFGPDNLRPQVEAYGLFTEPWLFVIDREGVVRERIEGAFSIAELKEALKRVTAS